MINKLEGVLKFLDLADKIEMKNFLLKIYITLKTYVENIHNTKPLPNKEHNNMATKPIKRKA